MKIIGLTGGIASGKSTVSKALTELGAKIIDADKTAHRLMEPGQPIYMDVINKFGPGILNPDKAIDRAKLGSIVFNDPMQMKILNKITGSRILEELYNQVEKWKAVCPNGVLILDIPLLYEAKMDKLCDQVWVVWLDRENQIQRLMERNGYTRQEALIRIESQMSLDEKARRADIVIDNSNSTGETLSLATKYYLDIMHQS